VLRNIKFLQRCFDLEDVNHLQPANEFMVMHQHGHEFESNPEENPVILSEFTRKKVSLRMA
jgi:hypothetical protein